MAIEFECQCGRQIKARDEYAGSPIKCPGCRASIQVPKPGEGEIARTVQSSGRTTPPPVVGGSSSPPGAEPWYYGFLIGFSLLCLAMAGLGFVLVAVAYLGSEGPSAPSLVALIVTAFGALSSLWMFALSLLVVEIGRKARKG